MPSNHVSSQISPLDTLKISTPETKPTSVASPVADPLDGLSLSSPLSEQKAPNYLFIAAFHSSTLKIEFSFPKQAGKPQTTSIKAVFTNLSNDNYTNFVFQGVVPKFIHLHMESASSNILPAGGTGSITQNLSVTNSQPGQKPLAMHIRIAYKVINQDMLEQGQINNFPPGL